MTSEFNVGLGGPKLPQKIGRYCLKIVVQRRYLRESKIIGGHLSIQYGRSLTE